MIRTLGMRIADSVLKHTHDDVVDIKSVANELGCRVMVRNVPTTDLGALITKKQDEEQHAIILNKNNRECENNTVIALLLAEHLINDLNDHPKPIYTCDVFSYREIRQYRFSRQMLLATRLALPDSVLDQLSAIDFDHAKYAQFAELDRSFVVSAYHGKEVGSILNIIESLEFTSSPINIKSA